MSPRDSKQFPKNNKDVDGNLPGQDLGEDSEDIDDSSGDSGNNSSGDNSSGDEINNRGNEDGPGPDGGNRRGQLR